MFSNEFTFGFGSQLDKKEMPNQVPHKWLAESKSWLAETKSRLTINLQLVLVHSQLDKMTSHTKLQK